MAAGVMPRAGNGGEGFPAPGNEHRGMAEFVTITQAAKALGISEKAVRRRVERKTFASVKRDGQRLISADGIRAARERGTAGHDASPRGTQTGASGASELAALIARLEELAAENGRLRALTEQAESLRVAQERDVHKAISERQAAEQLGEELARKLDEIAQASPLKALRLRRALRA